MDTKLSLLRLASDLAAHATARQSVIAENIAHADTPGYRARDIPGFAEAMNEPTGFAPRATRPGHMAFADQPRFEPREETALGAETPNGNSVSLEDQMVRAAELRSSHEMALGVYRKTMDVLRTGIGKGR
jgi:flagellar basal-body rod protein FlgB